MFKNYMQYLRNNPERYWFKRKLYGWGWTPARWQGWVSILIYIVVLVLLSRTVNQASTPNQVILRFIIPAAVATIVLIIICFKTGEKPKWQWGNNNPNDI